MRADFPQLGRRRLQRLAPTGDYDLAEERASIVLDRMEDAGFIDASAATAARARRNWHTR